MEKPHLRTFYDRLPKPSVTYAAIIGLCILSVFACTYYVLLSPAAVSADTYAAMAHDEKTRYWGSRIQESGGKAAYRELGEHIANDKFSTQHFDAHIFGDALYHVEGIQGISVCDDRFLYGCFHSFGLAATRDRGTGGAQALYDACREVLGNTSPQCEHGIGHGFLSTIGTKPYVLSELTEALAECDLLTPQPRDPANGCRGGAFMEYNLRSEGTYEGTSTPPRLFSPDEALEPCASLPSIYQGSCAFWQPQWWIVADPDRHNHALMARKMGAWCTELASSSSDENDVMNQCIAGVANQIQVLADDQPSRTGTVCATVTSDPDYRYHCHNMSVIRFMFYHPVSDSLQACAGLPSEYERACRDRHRASAASTK